MFMTCRCSPCGQDFQHQQKKFDEGRYKMDMIRLPAFAKINWTLDVGSLRPDGYHEISSVMQSVSLYDSLTLTCVPEGLSVACLAPGVPSGAANIAYRAMELIAPQIKTGVRVEIVKRIPVAAGLGGGSSDAAAVLVGLNRMLQIGWGESELLAAAAEIGSDVPFFITGGTALTLGRGEKVLRLAPAPKTWLVLVTPECAVSTADVYARFTTPLPYPRTPRMVQALKSGDRMEMLSSLSNDLEAVTSAALPQIELIKIRLLALGAEKALMSGSGPTVYGIFPSPDQAAEAASRLREQWLQVYLCQTIYEEDIAGGGVEVDA
jgi:4-diphosphocytidyl-2-C-methyl-D-erythritol kinase